MFHCQSARRTAIAGQRRNPKSQPNHSKPTNRKTTHETRAPRKSEAKRPAKCLLLSVSSRLKGKSADRWSALGVCQRDTDPTTNHRPTNRDRTRHTPNARIELLGGRTKAALKTWSSPTGQSGEVGLGSRSMREPTKQTTKPKNHPTKPNQQPNNPTKPNKQPTKPRGQRKLLLSP